MEIKSKLLSNDSKPLKDHLSRLLEKLLENPDPEFLTNFEAESYHLRHNLRPPVARQFRLDGEVEASMRAITGVAR